MHVEITWRTVPSWKHLAKSIVGSAFVISQLIAVGVMVLAVLAFSELATLFLTFRG